MAFRACRRYGASMTANQTVATVVDQERRRRGLTRLQLAALLGTNSAWVSRKLNGDRAWTMDDLDLVSERLGLPLPVLLMRPVVERATQRCRTLVQWATRRYHTRTRPMSLVTA